jgi:diaminopimelate epimerase
MEIPFWKAYAEGNSYVIVDAIADAGTLLAWVADGGRGLAGDGVLLADWRDDATVGMRVFNADGTEAPACVNGARCLAALAVLTTRHDGRSDVVVQSSGASLTNRLVSREGHQLRLSQSMAVPPEPVIWRDEQSFQVDLGTAHRVVFTDLAQLEVDSAGRRYAQEWPGGTNVMFVGPVSAGSASLRVVPWERGVGPTGGCASGAAAAVIAAAEREPGLAETVTVGQPGGRVDVRRRPDSVEITGTVRFLAHGSLIVS